MAGVGGYSDEDAGGASVSRCGDLFVDATHLHY